MTRVGAEWALLGATRFALALIVFGSHLSWFAPSPFTRALTTFNALAAVIGFLVISGYSIAHSIEREPQGFYRRRALRIMPI